MGITLSPWMMAFLVLMTGFAGFVDSAAGGGGLISLPAYLFAGLPPHYTYATNKFSAACGTTFATANFFKNGAMNLKVGILAAIGSFAGSALGAHIVLLLSDEMLRTMMFIILPVAAVLIVLLMRADAAFEGLMDMLPDTDWSEPVISLFFGVFAGWILYSRGVGLKYGEKNGKARPPFRGFSAITVNILLGTVCLIYAVYLLSQLAYLGGGFAGILPDGYTLAEYARRGFFEMAWLSFINLGLMCLAMGLVEKKAGAPALTRGLCLFLGLAALFLIAAASAKMLLYIGGYGLTRKRVLTEVFMLWLGVTTILVSVWLFKPRFPYMKGAVICALILGCVTFWADVDTQVARYNVRAYQSGQLETIDMGHMSSLGDGALPYIKGLTHDRDPEIASTAMDILENSYCSISDFRSWTYTQSAARKSVETA